MIRRGDVVGMPTETVYGLAGAAHDEMALTRIFGVKARPSFDPLIIHVSPGLLAKTGAPHALEALGKLKLVDVSALSGDAEKMVRALMDRFWPGPLTLILPKMPHVPDLATSGLPTVAIRMPLHPVAQALIDESGQPLAAPSANRFGRISPTEAMHVEKELGGRVEIILDGGPCAIGLESSVVSVNPLLLLRPGSISQSQLSEVISQALGKPTPVERATSHMVALSKAAQKSPGMLESHYSPKKPFGVFKSAGDFTVPHFSKWARGSVETLGLLLWSRQSHATALEYFKKYGGDPAKVLCLTETNDVAEAARNLFAMLRTLDDEADVDHIWAEPCPKDLAVEGLGYAIADRLARAAGPSQN